MSDADSLLIARAVRIQKDAARIEADISALMKYTKLLRKYADDSGWKEVDARLLLSMGDKALKELVQPDKGNSE